MSTDSNPVDLCTRVLLLKLADLLNQPAQVAVGVAARLRGLGLRSWEPGFLVVDLRLGLDDDVEDAERHAISDGDANSIAVLKALIRWLRAGLAVAVLAGRSGAEPSQVVSLLYGPEEPSLAEIVTAWRCSAGVEQANGDAFRATLDELVRAQDAAGSADDESESGALTETELRRFGHKVDELRADANLTVGGLSLVSGVDVVSIVALIRGGRGSWAPGADEVGVGTRRPVPGVRDG